MDASDSTKQNDFIQNIDESKLLSLENKLRLVDHNINKQGMNELVFKIGELFINSAKQLIGYKLHQTE